MIRAATASQAGIRAWLLRTARSGRHELRGIGAPAVLPLLCAAALGQALADADGPASAAARMGVLASVGADILAHLLEDAASRARSAHGSGPAVSAGPPPDLLRSLEREISLGVGEALAARDKHADGLRSDIAMVMREIDAGGTVFRAAIEAGDEELEREVLAAFEVLAAEFGDMAFMLADLARAAGEIQDSLGGQGAELRAASELVGRQSAEVRMIRAELAVIERRTRQWQPEPADPGPGWTGGCPYRGLLPYDQAHEAVFHGRERLTTELAGRVAGTGIVMVTGASGAGKTSLLQAGLVPALARGVQVPGSSAWPVVSLTATARPLTDLAAGLAALDGRDPAAIRQRLAGAPGEAHLLIREITRPAGDASRLVLIIDQFEQVFAADGPDERLERAAFIDAVCAAAARPAGPRAEPAARVVIAVRGDYWDRCAAYPQLVPAMERDQLVVGPMPEAGLRHAITGPAGASGVRVESALIDAIVADTRAAGALMLPMLSQALTLTWEKREGDRLTREGYERAGRVAGAVEVSAEAVYAGLTQDQQAIARDVLRRMTTVGHDGGPTRRPASRAELRAGQSKDQRAEAGAVLDALARSRLVVLRAGTAEIAHDVLLQAWPRLRDWLEEDQSSLILYGQLAEDTARWRQSGKDSSQLYRGVQLAAAREATRVWAADPGRYPALAAAEAEFLRAGGQASTRARWGRRTLAGALVLLLVAALAGAGLAVRSARNNASQQRVADLSERLAAQSTALEADDPVTASLLAGAAWRIAPTAQARYSLRESVAQPVRGILAAPSGTVTAVAYSPGGNCRYRDGTIRLWDIASHRLLSTATWGVAALALAFTGGGKALEVAGPAAVGVWNLSGQARIAAQPLAGLTGGRCVAFSPDGATLATGGGDGTVQLWDATTHQEAGPTMAAGPAAVRALAFSPGGKFLAAGGGDGNVRLWDTATHSQAGATMATGAPVAAVSFNANGATLATAGSDGGTELWAFATQEQTGAALGSGRASALAFNPSADVLATGDGNGTIELWDPSGFHQSSAPIATGTPESPAAADGHAPAVLSAHGDVLAVSDDGGTVRLWNALTRRPAWPIASHHEVTGLALSPDGKTLATIGADGTAALWSVATQHRIGALMHAGASAAQAAGGRGTAAVAFSPDGTTLATAGAAAVPGCGTWPPSRSSARRWRPAPSRSTRSPSAPTAPRSPPPAPAAAPAAAPGCGTWPSRPGCWPPPAP